MTFVLGKHNEIAKVIDAWCLKRTLRELSYLTGVSVRTLQRVKNGKTTRLRTILKIVSAIDQNTTKNAQNVQSLSRDSFSTNGKKAKKDVFLKTTPPKMTETDNKATKNAQNVQSLSRYCKEKERSKEKERQNTTTTMCSYIGEEEYEEFKKMVCRFFLDAGLCADPLIFIDYNESRGWLGSGGAPLWVNDRWKDYAYLWEKREKRR